MRKIMRHHKLWLGLVVVLIALIALRLNSPRTIKTSLKNDEVLLNRSDIVSVVRAPLDDVIYFTGDLTPKEQTIISAEVDARITKVWVDEGQVVKAGQALAELDTLDLAQALSQQQAQVTSARAKYDLEQQKLDKQRQLFEQGFISKIAYDELVTNKQAAWQFYRVQAALLKRSQRQLADTHISAPFAGVIYQKNIQPGQLALKNTKLFALANLEVMEIKAAISSDQINKIKLGQAVNFKVETADPVYQGKISRINQVAQLGTRSYMIYINFANHNYGLKAGQFIKGTVILQHLEQQQLIPCDAIREGSNHSQYVLRLNSARVESQTISIILSNMQSNQCAVSGLVSGDQVLAGNVLTVKAGDHARVVD